MQPAFRLAKDGRSSRSHQAVNLIKRFRWTFDEQTLSW